MTYLHCPRCRLAINCRAPYLTMTHCSRCLARATILKPLFASTLNGHELRVGPATPVTEVGQTSARLQEALSHASARNIPRRAP
jgi:hypothetical protein